MQKQYITPQTEVVELKMNVQLLAGSPDIKDLDITGLDLEELIDIDDTPAGDGFMGR